MKIMNIKDLDSYGRDVYEFSYGDKYPDEFWNETSIFIAEEDFSWLTPYLDKVFLNYHYYGPQKVSLDKWEEVKRLYLSDNKNDKDGLDFFINIDKWINQGNKFFDYFWILGI